MNYNNEICSQCNYPLYVCEDQLMICSNNKCGIIFKDIIDQSAEWRFYGADDNNNNDPTRCGMPINPLLKESSCSCKVLCGNKSSYEMHKIRRYTDWQSMPYKEKSRYDEFQLIIKPHPLENPKNYKAFEVLPNVKISFDEHIKTKNTNNYCIDGIHNT